MQYSSVHVSSLFFFFFTFSSSSWKAFLFIFLFQVQCPLITDLHVFPITNNYSLPWILRAPSQDLLVMEYLVFRLLNYSYWCVFLAPSVEYLESRLLKSHLHVLFKSYIVLQILFSTLEYLEKVPRPLQHMMTQKYPTEWCTVLQTWYMAGAT